MVSSHSWAHVLGANSGILGLLGALVIIFVAGERAVVPKEPDGLGRAGITLRRSAFEFAIRQIGEWAARGICRLPTRPQPQLSGLGLNAIAVACALWRDAASLKVTMPRSVPRPSKVLTYTSKPIQVLTPQSCK